MIRIIELPNGASVIQEWQEHRGGWFFVKPLGFAELSAAEQKQLLEQIKVP
jgi:hypothetical protein